MSACMTMTTCHHFWSYCCCWCCCCCCRVSVCVFFFVSMTISSTKNWASDDNDETQEIFSSRLRNLIRLIPTERGQTRVKRYKCINAKCARTCKQASERARERAGIVLSFVPIGIVGCACDMPVWCVYYSIFMMMVVVVVLLHTQLAETLCRHINSINARYSHTLRKQ